MLVSVIIPAYNAAGTIRKAVASMLAQSHSDIEVLVADDGSTDATRELLETFDDPRLRVFSDSINRGRCARLNQLIGEARGEYVARMDADDLSVPSRIRDQLAYATEHGIDLIGGAMLVIDERDALVGRRSVPGSQDKICARPWAGFRLPHPTWLVHRSVYQRFAYGAEYLWSDDQEFLLRCHRHIRLGNLEDPVLLYREARIDLRKIRLGRREWSRALIEQRHEESLATVVRGVTGQIGKFAVDVAAAKSGLGYRLLRQRAEPALPDDAAVWRAALDAAR